MTFGIEPTSPLDRASLHDRIARHLREDLTEGALEPGSRIDEKALCQRFAVSRTPLREALKVLAAEGLIELLPNRGARVAKLDEQDVRDMFDVMAALEALSGRLACARISEAEIDEIAALHFRMLAHWRRRERAAYFQANQAIHEAILEAARNPVLTATYRGLAGRIRRARFRANMDDARWAEAVAEHEAILEALRARDGNRLAVLLQSHLEHKQAVVQASLNEMSAAEAAA
jgi:DNA-binding GntR family transcriptional regulator